MIETRRLKNAVIFVQTILSFVLSRKIIKDSLAKRILITNIRYCDTYTDTNKYQIFGIWYLILISAHMEKVYKYYKMAVSEDSYEVRIDTMSHK